MAKRLEVFVEKGKDLYACTFDDVIEKCNWSGDGSTAEKAIRSLKECEKLMRETKAAEGVKLPAVEYTYRFDIGSFFNYYSYLNVSEVARRLGISPSLMRKYAAGICTPSEKRLREIEVGLKAIAAEIKDIRLWAFRQPQHGEN